MKRNSSRILSFLTALILITSVLLLCASCGATLPYTDLSGVDSVTRLLHLSERVPDFNTSLFSSVELCFLSYYYKELEDNDTLAEKTIAAYEEFCTEVDSADREAVTLNLIDCYIYAVGDNYAFFRTPDEAEDYSADLNGTFVGIGVSVIREDRQKTIEVIGVEPDSPANKAGIMAGDFIVAVNGERIEDSEPLAMINKIKGEEGTEVNVTVLRGEEEITFTMIRARISETTVTHSMLADGNVGYIKITGFKGNTAEMFFDAVNAVEAAGAKAVIFDLRDNPGGLLNAVCDMLSYLVPDGTKIASFSNGKKPVYASSGSGRLEKTDHVLSIPSVVLCNSSSASASELFSGAMRDYNDMGILTSTVAGETTFKKGIMQSEFNIARDGSTLTLTVALYNPPSGENFHEVGVIPDVMIPAPEAGDNTNGDDVYISTALSILGY